MDKRIPSCSLTSPWFLPENHPLYRPRPKARKVTLLEKIKYRLREKLLQWLR